MLTHNRATVYKSVALVGNNKCGKHAQSGGLACTIGAQQTEDLALVGGEREIVDCDNLLPFRPFYFLLFARELKGFAEALNAKD